MPFLADDAVATGCVDAAHDRADVVRILDAVEDDEQRWVRCRAVDELLHAVITRRVNFRRNPLVDAAARQPFEHLRINTLDLDACRLRQCNRFVDALVTARANLESPHTSRA